jgi:hypothetical protein
VRQGHVKKGPMPGNETSTEWHKFRRRSIYIYALIT